MNRQTFERQQQYAGPVQPSMKRRAIDHDYHERRIYMITSPIQAKTQQTHATTHTHESAAARSTARLHAMELLQR